MITAFSKSIVSYVPIVVNKWLIIIALILFPAVLTAQAHEDCNFCKAVKSGNFYSVNKQFKWEVNQRKNGTLINNTYYVHNTQINDLVLWLRSHPAVLEATQETCAIHISIYPGWTYIGARFKTEDSIVEKSFYIQLGKNHRFKSRLRSLPICIFNKLSTESDIMVYKGMNDNPGFCEQQRINCKRMAEQDSVQRLEYLKALAITADTFSLRMKVINKTGGNYKNQYGIQAYNYIAILESDHPGKNLKKGDTLGLRMNLSKENVEWLKNWTDPRPPMGWELINTNSTYKFIINNTLPPDPCLEKKILIYYLYGGANCVVIVNSE